MIEDFEILMDDGRRKIFCNGSLLEINEFIAELKWDLESMPVGDYVLTYPED